jgi:hypothetical protein
MGMIKLFELWKRYSYVLLLAFIVVTLFDFRIGMVAIICMIAPIIVSVLWKSRKFLKANFQVLDEIKTDAQKKLPKPSASKRVCGTYVTGIYDQKLIDNMLGLDGDNEFVVYLAAVGRHSS